MLPEQQTTSALLGQGDRRKAPACIVILEDALELGLGQEDRSAKGEVVEPVHEFVRGLSQKSLRCMALTMLAVNDIQGSGVRPTRIAKSEALVAEAAPLRREQVQEIGCSQVPLRRAR